MTCGIDQSQLSNCWSVYACVYTQSDVFAQLPVHETVVPCSSKDLQLPDWVVEGQAVVGPRTRHQQAAAVQVSPRSRSARGVKPDKERSVSAKRTNAPSAAARRQECTNDASPTSRQSLRRF